MEANYTIGLEVEKNMTQKKLWTYLVLRMMRIILGSG